MLVLKIFNSIWQTILGIIILFDRKLKDLIFVAIKNELGERPNNFLASYILHTFKHVSYTTEIYIGFYILFQGLLKLLLIIGLFKKQLWAYPTAIYIFFCFISLCFFYNINCLNNISLLPSSFFKSAD